ncbi:hypothetical protein S7711_04800 [Stachybotrys chartarum IBT 7711]|uniref:Myb-like domain-containing protein n=1 Tax=Stachybotrys chartarum (strain CBS 109288 / IBT 7711) TaxID=1280523 RepID=A0A084AMD9_STACB|nr:hypothetical protein S7711_04800 [Stachybotrys chartarum IBT 7711]
MFWETLYIGALDKSWRIVDQRALQLRFGWGLDYIRKGSLSPEVQRAKEILQQALVDISARSKHPYTYDTGLSTATHLNPDLCTHWTGEFLSVSSALPKVKLGIQNCMQGFGIRRFRSTFGILSALLWEETASICYPDITADDDRQVVPSGDEDHCGPISTLQSFRPLVSALSTDHVDSDEMVGHGSPDAREQKGGDSWNSNPEEELITARRLPQSVPTSISGLPCATSPPSPSSSPMSPPPYSPLQHHSRIWHGKEDEYLRFLLECDITWSQRHIKFQGRKTVLPSYRECKKDWTSDEIQCLRSLLETERSRDDVATKLEEKFNNGRTMGAMKLKAQIRKMDTSRFNNEPWTAEQEDYLKVLKSQGISYKEWTESFRGRFGFRRTEAALRARHIALGVDTDTSNTVHWTDDELNFVRELMPLNLRHTEICERFWKEFGTELSQFSINRKYQIMKESSIHGEPSGTGKQQWWESDEDKFILEWSGRLVDLFPAFSQKFGTHRTKTALVNRYYMGRMRRQLLSRSRNPF